MTESNSSPVETVLDFWTHNSSWFVTGQTKVDQLDFKRCLSMVHQHDIFKLQVCMYELNRVQVVQRSGQLKKKAHLSCLICGYLVNARRNGKAYTCWTIGRISLIRRGWKFLSSSRWRRLLSSCSNSRHKCPLSSKAPFHWTMLHSSRLSFLNLCKLEICRHKFHVRSIIIKSKYFPPMWYLCTYKHNIWLAEEFGCLPP